MRLGANYVLQAARLVAEAIDRDMVKALIFMAISRANVSAFTATSDAVATYGGSLDIPPDDVRTPVTTYRIARDLGLPYETVRRNASILRAAGLCRAVPGGLIVPLEVYKRPGMVRAVERNYQLTIKLVHDLRAIGITSNLPRDSATRDVSRQTVRLATQFFLDTLRLMANVMDLDFLDVVLVCATSLANLDHIMRNPVLSAKFGGMATPPPDAERTEVSAYAVAAILLMPYETARRRLKRLVNRGLMEQRGATGYVVPEAVMVGPRVNAGAVELAKRTEEFLTQLSEIGVAARTGI